VNRPWLKPRAIGSGTMRVVEVPGAWAVEIDGTQRTFKSSYARAAKAADTIFAALVPDGCCPVCARRVGKLGKVWCEHNQPRVHSEKRRRCPGSGLRVGGEAA